MKKFVCLLLTICMILGVLSGCRKDHHESTLMSTIATTEVAEEAITVPTAEVPTESEPAEAAGTPGVIRKIPKAEAVNVVTQLKVGTEITVYEVVTIADGNEWGRIDQGWILMDLVQLNDSEPSTAPT